MLGRLPNLNLDEAAAVVNMISFVGEGAQSLYGGALVMRDNLQYPNLHELRAFCESIESPSDL
jgi:hypothetical protein